MFCTIHNHRNKLRKIVFQCEAMVSTQDPRTLRDYVKQIYRWDTGTWQVGLKYGMATGLGKIDWEYKLLMGEGLIFAAVFLLLPVWLLFYPAIASFAVGMDFAVLALLCVVCAACERRGDVLLSLPGYDLLRFMVCSVFFYSFC